MMNRTLIVAGPCAVRLPALRQPSVRPPALRLVLPDRDGPWHPIGSAVRVVRPAVEPAPASPAAVAEEDAERWDGLS
jgi:hypothetical protein